jgi:IstB-like ATP binding protein
VARHELRLPTRAEVLADWALRAAKDKLTHEAFRYQLVLAELEGRTQRRTERAAPSSRICRRRKPSEASISRASIWPHARSSSGSKAAPSSMRRSISWPWAEPFCGKTHLACALGHALIEQGRPVLFCSTYQLVQELAFRQA